MVPFVNPHPRPGRRTISLDHFEKDPIFFLKNTLKNPIGFQDKLCSGTGHFEN